MYLLQSEAKGAGFVQLEENRFREDLITLFKHLKRSCREDRAKGFSEVYSGRMKQQS